MTAIDERNRSIQYRFIHSASLEMVKSIHVVADPDHHIYCSEWAKTANARLTEELKDEIRFFAERYVQWTFVMDLVGELAYYSGGADDLDLILAKIERMKPVTFSVFFLGLSAYNPEPARIQYFLAHPEQAGNEALAGGAGKMKDADIRYFFFHVDEIKARLCRTLRQYWIAVFAPEWESINRYLMTVIKRGMMQIERYGLVPYICSLHDKIFVEDGRLIFNKAVPFSIELSEINEIVITPSVFAYPHLYGNIFRGKVNIALSMNYNAVKINDAVPTKTLELLHILSDETRFRIIKALWGGDATTSELAELLTLSQSTVSLQLKLMKEAGIVEITKINKFTYYKLNKDPFYLIQQTLLGCLED